MSRSDKTAIVIKDNHDKRGKRQHAPLVAVVEQKHQRVEDIFSRTPAKTDWVESMLTGGSSDYLDKLEPITETEIKAIFPRATATVMKDPLTTTDKQRIHDNIRRDPYTAIAMFTYCYFMLGPESNITMGLNRIYANEQRKQEHLKEIMEGPESPGYLDIMELIMNRDNDMNLQQRKLELVFSGTSFGRSVQIKQYDKKNRVCGLIPLSSTRMGRVWVDKDWTFLGVEYNDYSRDKRILLAKDIIHYENNDMVITPRGRYYGTSMLEPLMSIGERNRVGNEIAIPEIMRKHWAPIMLVKVNTGSQSKINAIRDLFSLPGKTVIYNDAIEVEVIPLTHDLEKQVNAIAEGGKDIFRGLTVPQGIGWSFDPNHATMENSLLQWYNGPIAFKRSHLDNVLWQQLYKPDLESIFEERLVQKIPETNGLVDYLVQNAARLQGEKPPLPFRITTEFKNIKTTGFLESAQAILGYKAAGIINNEIALKEGGLSEYIDDMAEEDAKKVSLANDMMSQEQGLLASGQVTPPLNINASATQKPSTTRF